MPAFSVWSFTQVTVHSHNLDCSKKPASIDFGRRSTNLLNGLQVNDGFILCFNSLMVLWSYAEFIVLSTFSTKGPRSWKMSGSLSEISKNAWNSLHGSLLDPLASGVWNATRGPKA